MTDVWIVKRTVVESFEVEAKTKEQAKDKAFMLGLTPSAKRGEYGKTGRRYFSIFISFDYMDCQRRS